MTAEDCLANTGSVEAGALMLVGAALVIAALVVFAVRAKKHTGKYLGAAMLVGALAFVPLASAPSIAHASVNDCQPVTSDPVSTPTPTPTPDPAPTPGPTPTPEPETTYVAPAAPTSAPVCGAAPMITIPDSDTFTYTTEQSGDVATVTATLNDGLESTEIEPSAQTVWTFDMAYTPVTSLTADDLAFTYDPNTSTDATLSNAETAALLESLDATFDFRTLIEYEHTWGVVHRSQPAYGAW